jgi:ribonuclease HI
MTVEMTKEPFFVVDGGGLKPEIFSRWGDAVIYSREAEDTRVRPFCCKQFAKDYIAGVNRFSRINLYDIEAYAFIDGSYNDENKFFGVGGYYVHYNNIYFDDETELIPSRVKITKVTYQGSSCDKDLRKLRNVAGEILASVMAIQRAIDDGCKELYIFYDYKGVEMWSTGQWQRNNNFTKSYYGFIQKHRESIHLHFVKVPAHSFCTENNMVDMLAKQAAGIINGFTIADSSHTEENEVPYEVFNFMKEEYKKQMDEAVEQEHIVHNKKRKRKAVDFRSVFKCSDPAQEEWFREQLFED